METLDPPPKIKDVKMARFFPSRAFILALGVGGGGGGGEVRKCLNHSILSQFITKRKETRLTWP